MAFNKGQLGWRNLSRRQREEIVFSAIDRNVRPVTVEYMENFSTNRTRDCSVVAYNMVVGCCDYDGEILAGLFADVDSERIFRLGATPQQHRAPRRDNL